MSLDASKWAWKQSDLKPTEKLTLLALAESVNGKGDGVTCWPSATRLEALTGLSRRAVFKALGELVERGKIQREPGTKGRATTYRLLIECTTCTSAPDALVQEVHGIVHQVHSGSAPGAPQSGIEPGMNQERETRTRANGKTHEIGQASPARDFTVGATPVDAIPWMSVHVDRAAGRVQPSGVGGARRGTPSDVPATS